MTAPVVRRTVSLLLLLLVSICSVDAQEPSPDTTSTVTVPDILIEAFRTPTSGDSTAYSVTSVEAGESARASAGLGLEEALTDVPGLQIDNRYNYALGERISIRGFGARTQFGVRGIRVVADGIPATFADGQSSLESIDPSSVAEAEVIQGPASALYGNASGGVILLRSPEPPAGVLLGTVRAIGGDNGLVRLEGSAAGTVGTSSYRVAGSNLRYDGYRDYSAARTSNFDGRYILRLGDDRLKIVAGYTSFSADNPGALSKTMLDADRFQAVANNVRQKAGKEGTQGEVGLQWSRSVEGTFFELSGDLRLRDISNPIPTTIIDLNRTALGFRGVVGSRFDLLGRSVNWAVGADVDVQLDDRQNHTNRDGALGVLTLDQQESVAGIGSFVSLSASLGWDLRLMGGLRYDLTRFSVTDRFVDANDPDDSGDRSMSALSPSAGLLWTPLEEVNLYTNVSTAFETPTTTELANRPSGAGGFNPDLDPQSTLSLEIGARGRITSDLRYRVSAYRATISNELISFQVPNVPDRDFFRNAGSSVHSGVEGSLQATPFSGMRASLAYTYTDARFDQYSTGERTFDGNRVPGVAPHRLSGRVSYLASFGVFGSIDARYVAETPVDDANSESSPAYAVVDLRLIWSDGIRIGLGGDWRMRIVPFAGVDNLLDRRYNTAVTVNAFGGRYYEPGPGRTLHAGIELRVGGVGE